MDRMGVVVSLLTRAFEVSDGSGGVGNSALGAERNYQRLHPT